MFSDVFKSRFEKFMEVKSIGDYKCTSEYQLLAITCGECAVVLRLCFGACHRPLVGQYDKRMLGSIALPSIVTTLL